MIQILPLTDLDLKPQLPESKLSTLHHAGIPIIDGVLLDPSEWFSQILRQSLRKPIDSRILERVIVDHLEHLQIPTNLKKHLKRGHHVVISGSMWLPGDKTWKYVISLWIKRCQQILATLQDQKIDEKDVALFHLPHVILGFPSEWGGIFQVRLDKKQNTIVIDTVDQLSKQKEKSIVDLVTRAQKHLILPYEYSVFVGKSIGLVGVRPSNEHIESTKKVPQSITSTSPAKPIQTVTKIYSLLGISYQIPVNTDGFYCQVLDEDTKSIIHRVSEVALSFPQKSVLLEMPNTISGKSGGQLNSRDNQLVQKYADILSKVRFQGLHQKGAYNLELVLPSCHSPHQMALIKQDLLACGIARKGTLKYWLPLTTVDNYLSFERYWEIGIDGVICQLDVLAQRIYDLPLTDLSVTVEDFGALFEVLKICFAKAFRNNCLVIVAGNLVSHQSILDFLIEHGVYGILLPLQHAETMQEHIKWTEERVMKRK
jgi:hypothetical protein